MINVVNQPSQYFLIKVIRNIIKRTDEILVFISGINIRRLLSECQGRFQHYTQASIIIRLIMEVKDLESMLEQSEAENFEWFIYYYLLNKYLRISIINIILKLLCSILYHLIWIWFLQSPIFLVIFSVISFHILCS